MANIRFVNDINTSSAVILDNIYAEIVGKDQNINQQSRSFQNQKLFLESKYCNIQTVDIYSNKTNTARAILIRPPQGPLTVMDPNLELNTPCSS